jgi:hypothetical protein
MELAEDAQSWVAIAEEQVQKRVKKIDSGQAEPLTWVGLSEWYMSLGRARFLREDALELVRAAFQEASRGIETCFRMAYDPSSPRFLGDKMEPSAVLNSTAIDGLNASLIAADFDQARRLVQWVPSGPPKAAKLDEDDLYVRGLKHLLLDHPDEARAQINTLLQRYADKPPRSGYKRNYYTLALALAGILEGNETKFLEGLHLQAEFYRALARGENADTPEEHMCDHLVALGNLGIHCGRSLASDIPFLPRQLLMPRGARGPSA